MNNNNELTNLLTICDNDKNGDNEQRVIKEPETNNVTPEEAKKYEDIEFALINDASNPTSNNNASVTRYLVIVVHQYDKNEDKITSKVANVFETDSQFKLTKTYSNNPNTKFGVNNYITVESGKTFQSRAKPYTNQNKLNNTSISFIENFKFNTYKNFNTILRTEMENQCIVFYEYDSNDHPKNWYYTKGILYAYGNGVAST
jgi:hypothetical protein